MFYQIFFLPQVKRFITYKNGMYELPHELRLSVRYFT